MGEIPLVESVLRILRLDIDGRRILNAERG